MLTEFPRRHRPRSVAPRLEARRARAASRRRRRLDDLAVGRHRHRQARVAGGSAQIGAGDLMP